MSWFHTCKPCSYLGVYVCAREERAHVHIEERAQAVRMCVEARSQYQMSSRSPSSTVCET